MHTHSSRNGRLRCRQQISLRPLGLPLSMGFLEGSLRENGGAQNKVHVTCSRGFWEKRKNSIPGRGVGKCLVVLRGDGVPKKRESHTKRVPNRKIPMRELKHFP